MSKIKITKIILMLLVSIFALSFIGNSAGLFNIKFWGVKYEDAHREVFEQTKSYRHGMIRDLRNLQMEYVKATDPDVKRVIKSTILHRVANFNDLPYDLNSFINQLRKN